MVSQRSTVSLVGQAIGIVVVTGLLMSTGIGLVPSAAVGLIGLFLGGWIAEKYFSDENTETRAAGG